MQRINQLSKNLVNQIAAGEVIERPASVVKELAENSIDAGATKIEISISNECRNIRIADNGSGIHPDDIELAFSKHATSKIKAEEDLWNISTLGFRGEALASIISIAKVNCTTRQQGFEYGTKIECENSEIKRSQTGCAYGTIMEINELFYNQSARLKFLKSSKTEFLYIQELVQSLAISHPDISFVLKHNNSVVINTPQNSDLLTRITDIYSKSFIEYLTPVLKTDELTGIKIEGYTSLPSYTRSSKKSIYTFVNSRFIKCPIIMKAIDIAYKNSLPSGKYPFVVINIDINPHEIDVNAHPTKKEIRYKNPNQIFNFVQSAISRAIENVQAIEPSQTQETKVISFVQNSEKEDNDSIYISADSFRQESQNVFPKIKYDKNQEIPINSQLQQKLYMPFQEAENNEEKIIGQLNNTYILIEKEDGLEIVDQHIADERYIYEKLKESKEPASQLLLISDVINLEATDVDLLMQAKAKLAQFGYQLEMISDKQVIFKKIPQIIAHVKPQDVITDLIENIKGDLDSIEEKILITTSCKAAVKAGQKLSIWQMEELIKKWRKTKQPHTCPHGRPITKTIPIKDIASYFLRQK